MSDSGSGNTVQPYLFFGGNCEEAVSFYQRALGAKVELMIKFNESPEAPPPGMLAPGFENKVMHASLRIRDSVVMASDGSNPDERSRHVSLSLTCANNAEVDKVFAALGEGGAVEMAPSKTFWSPYFGMLTDRFGIGWMVGVEHGE